MFTEMIVAKETDNSFLERLTVFIAIIEGILGITEPQNVGKGQFGRGKEDTKERLYFSLYHFLHFVIVVGSI